MRKGISIGKYYFIWFILLLLLTYKWWKWERKVTQLTTANHQTQEFFDKLILGSWSIRCIRESTRTEMLRSSTNWRLHHCTHTHTLKLKGIQRESVKRKWWQEASHKKAPRVILLFAVHFLLSLLPRTQGGEAEWGNSVLKEYRTLRAR